MTLGWRSHTSQRRSPTTTEQRNTGTSAPPLELVGVAKTFPGAVPVHALSSTSLRIDAGELIGIVGPSGSGKSTLLNLLGLLDTPTAGEYYVGGFATSTARQSELAWLRATVFGFVFQHFHLLEDQTATENVALGLLYQGLGHRQRTDRAVAVLERVGLGHRLDAFPTTLSGGESQRVAIARAVALSPGVLLCDEPTGNLDRANSHEVLTLLRELNADGLTVVIVTHDRSIAEGLPRCIEVVDGLVQL